MTGSAPASGSGCCAVPAGRGHRAGHLRPLSLLVAAFNSSPEVIAYGVADARTVSLFYFLLAFSTAVQAFSGGPGGQSSHGYHAGHLVRLRIAYITAVTHFIPRYSGDLLGLSADLVPGRPAVCRLPSPAPFPLRCRTGNVPIK